MPTCSASQMSVNEMTNQMIDSGFFMSSEYIDANAVSSIKQFLIGIDLPAFRDITDTFILYKGAVGSYLVEFANGCGQLLAGLNAATTADLLRTIGNPI